MSWSSGRLRYLTPRRLVFHTSVRRVARKALTTIGARPYANGPPAPVPSHITNTPGHSRLSALESQHCRVPRVSHRGAPRPRTTRPRTRDRAVCHRGPLDTRYSFHADTAQEQSKRGPSPSACISAPRQRRGDFSAVAVCCVRKAQERRASIADPSDLRRRVGHDAARCSSSLAQSWTARSRTPYPLVRILAAGGRVWRAQSSSPVPRGRVRYVRLPRPRAMSSPCPVPRNSRPVASNRFTGALGSPSIRRFAPLPIGSCVTSPASRSPKPIPWPGASGAGRGIAQDSPAWSQTAGHSAPPSPGIV